MGNCGKLTLHMTNKPANSIYGHLRYRSFKFTQTAWPIPGTLPHQRDRTSLMTGLFPECCAHGRDWTWNRTCRHSRQSVPPMSQVHSQAVQYQYGALPHEHGGESLPDAAGRHLSVRDGYRAPCRDNEWRGHRTGRYLYRATWQPLPQTAYQLAAPDAYAQSANNGQLPVGNALIKPCGAHRPQGNTYR